MPPAKIKAHEIFEIYTDFRQKGLFTKSLLKPAMSHFGERIVKEGGASYRNWEPKRSKLAAYVMKGCPNTGIRAGSVVLYLGASHGHTPSYVSDMIGSEGFMFCLDFAPRVMRDLVFLCESRENMAPIMADAHHPESYMDRVCEVDVVFQDIAQRDQAEIFLRNCRMFLKDGGVGLLAVKARSIDIKKDSKQIFAEVRDMIAKEFMVTDMKSLEPFELDHCMIAIKKRPPIDESPKSKPNANATGGSRRQRMQRAPVRPNVTNNAGSRRQNTTGDSERKNNFSAKPATRGLEKRSPVRPFRSR